MMENLNNLLEDNGQPGLTELRHLLHELYGASPCRFLEEQKLPSRHSRVYRLRFASHREVRSLVVKRLEPAIAQRNQLVTSRWLPAIGLGESGPTLIGVAAERNGQCVWHVYEDLGDWALDANAPDRERVKAAVELIAQIHRRFSENPLLPECRLYGGDLGINFFTTNVRDAIRGLELLRPPAIELSSEHAALRDRLLARLYSLLDQQPARAQSLAELGGPETLLHGDLWTTNTFVLPTARGLQARLIDWDHAGVGPVTYDLSTFLLRFPSGHRLWIWDTYRAAMSRAGWRLPPMRDANALFETAEYARFANRITWPAMALARGHAEWAFDELAEIEQWFRDLQPVLPGTAEASATGALRP